MKHALLPIVPLIAAALGNGLAVASETGPVLVAPAEVKWTAGPPSMSPGAQMAVISGDLKSPAPFTFRLKLPASYRIAPHTHPAIEHVTVISGTLYMGPGDKPDRTKAKALTPGSLAVFPAGHSMYAWTEGETVIQVHGVGPWGIEYLDAADDPRKP
ncbi:cupin [Sulfurifustis variabilis]|uniref:Cupin n=1 Tax=Sulfurifustis variabilis TaxID=1675686 RepID=A0A1B4V6F6_9GAMM|nr:cupin domain-containing protein [Sulfurifustis variabilis]BAU49098.1 cupin [Sulfurifustis variabilis]